MICQHCKREIADDVRYCTWCGEAVMDYIPPKEPPEAPEGEPGKTTRAAAEQAGGQVIAPDPGHVVSRSGTTIVQNTLGSRAQTQAGYVAGPGARVVPQRPTRNKKGDPLVVFAVVVTLALLVTTVLVAANTGFLDTILPAGGGRVEEKPGSAGEGAGGSSSESSVSSGKTEVPGSQEGTEGLAVRGALSEYSWGELAQIAELIEDCSDSATAMSIAEQYHLVDDSGKYYAATKNLEMSDGTSVPMRLIGVGHDKASTTLGAAGLTFLASEVRYHHRMSSSKYMPGGWAATELRSWLNGDLYQKLPADVRDAVVPVAKKTNNDGSTTSTSSVTETSDKLWVPSIVELTGVLDWTYQSKPENSDAWNAVFNAEGRQYPAFAQASIVSDDANAVFDYGEPWWLRSTSSASSRGRYVGANGDPSMYGDANENWGVVFGLCL